MNFREFYEILYFYLGGWYYEISDQCNKSIGFGFMFILISCSSNFNLKFEKLSEKFEQPVNNCRYKVTLKRWDFNYIT